MATTPTYPVEQDLFSALSGKVADAVFAKDTETKGTTKQDTTGTSAQNTATTGATDSTQLTNMLSAVTGSNNTQQTGTTAQQQAGTQTQNSTGTTGTTGGTTQNSTQQQSTSGNTSTTGTQATTGTVGTTGSQATTGTNTTTQNADTTALREVLSRQLGGATPEMLQAIFQEGAKAAPNLVVAQAGALGARGVGNSPMAQVLNQLNADLTNKAAMLNVQMLSDAGNTAGKIADLTKSSTVATDQVTKSTSEQVQDLLSTTNTQQMSKQIADTINATVGTMNQQQTQSQATTGTTAMNTTGQTAQNTNQQTQQNTDQSTNVAANVNTTQNQAQTGTQTQSSTLVKDEKVRQQQALNSNLIGKSAGLIAGGLGLSAAYNAAKSSGFLGKAADFVKGLLSNGTAPAVIDRALRMDNLPGILAPTGQLDLSALGKIDLDSLINNLPDLGSILPDLGGGGGFFDGVLDFFGDFADGGQLDFLPVPKLDGKAKLPEMDNTLEAMLSGAVGVSGLDGLFGGGGGSSSSGANNTIGGDVTSGAGGEGGAAGSNAGGVNGVSVGNIGTPNGGTGMSNSTAGTIGSIAAAMAGMPGMLGKATAEAINAALNSQASNAIGQAANAAANAAAVAADQAANISIGEAEAGFGMGSIGDAGMGAIGGTGAGDPGGDAGESGGVGAGDSGDSGGGGSGGEGSSGGEGGTGGAGDGGDFANGGRLVKGPGTGISDSVPGRGPNGEAIRVSHGEYIIPADVVDKFGPNAFDNLVAKHHVPAAMQRAIMGE